MNLQSLLLDKYPVIETFTMNRYSAVITVSNKAKFNSILEKSAINFKETNEDNTISYHKFGVIVVDDTWPSEGAKVFIPKDSLESVMKNLLV